MAVRVFIVHRDSQYEGHIDRAVRVALDTGVVDVVRSREPLPSLAELQKPPCHLVVWSSKGFEDIDEAWIRSVLGACPLMDILVVAPPLSRERLVSLLGMEVSYVIEKPLRAGEMEESVVEIFRLRHMTETLPGGCRRIAVSSEIKDWVELTAPSHLVFLDRFNHFVRMLARTKMPRREIQGLIYAINEIGQNAIEWGNRKDPGKLLRISYCILRDRVLLKIEDEGEGFPVEDLSDPTGDPHSHLRSRRELGKRVGGYGIWMVRGLMDEVLYNEKGNAVVLTKYTGSAAGATRKGVQSRTLSLLQDPGPL